MKRILTMAVCICMMLAVSSCASDIEDSPKRQETTASHTTAQTTSEQQTTTTSQAATTSQTTTTTLLTTTASQTDEEKTEAQMAVDAAPTATTSVSASTTKASTTSKSTKQTAKATITTAASFADSAAQSTQAPTQSSVSDSSAATSAASTAAQTTTKKETDHSDTSPKLFYITQYTNLYDLNKAAIGALYAGCFYSGHYDPKYPGFVVIDYLYSKCLVAESAVKVQSGAKILPTAAIGQMGGSIWGQASCGPTAATILVNSQLGLGWTKDNMILYCENNRLNDQGSLRYGGGITAPNLIKAINGYSGGKVTASNIYGSDPASILKKQIDSGNRSIVVVQYTSSIVTHYASGTHFVVICGYENIGGVLYFYYADPYYSYGGRSLLRVSASTLATSMNMVSIEPRCIITVK